MAASTKWMPSLTDQFMPLFAASAQAAASQCTGTIAGLYGNACGFKWAAGTGWDGTYGFGQQLDALEVIQANLIQSAGNPVTAKTGGISHGNPNAGTGGDSSNPANFGGTITTASKAGASILTAFMVIGWLAAIWWMYV